MNRLRQLPPDLGIRLQDLIEAGLDELLVPRVGCKPGSPCSLRTSAASEGNRESPESTLPVDRGGELASLEREASSCVACRLARTRTKVVFGVGNPRARLMCVGEAPGFHEDRQGEPFVGKAGNLLDRMLAKIDLKRQEVYIANVLKCRPPENRDPLPDEIETCNPFLARQIELVDPKVILALGAHAARTMLDLPPEVPVGRLRGRVHSHRRASLIVTYHPAYLLRNPQARWKALEDLHRVRDLLAGRG